MVISRAYLPATLLVVLLIALTFNLPNAVALNLGNRALTHVLVQQDLSLADAAKGWLGACTPSAACYRGLTRVYAAQGQVDQAIQSGKHAVSLRPGDPLAAYWLGQAYWDADEKEMARELWRITGVIKGKLDYLVWLGWSRAERGDLFGAEAAIKESLDLDPEYGVGYDSLATILWGQRWDEVEWALRQAIAYLPQDSAAWYWNIGRLRLLHGDWPQAAQALQASVDRRPNEWPMRFLAEALERSGDSDSAARVRAEVERQWGR